MRFMPGCKCCPTNTTTVACSATPIPTTLHVTYSGGTGAYAGLNGLSFAITYFNNTNSSGELGYWFGTHVEAYPGGSSNCCIFFYIFCSSTTVMQYNNGSTTTGSCPSDTIAETNGGAPGTIVSTSPFHWTVTFTAPASGSFCGVAVAAGDKITMDVTA